MSNNIITLNHPIFNQENAVRRLCKPLFAYTPMKHFAYDKYYFDGSMISLNQSKDIAYEVYNNNLLPTLDELHQINSQFAFLSTSLDLPEIAYRIDVYRKNIAIVKDIGIHHRLCLMYKNTQYTEVFVYGLINQKNPMECFLNYLPHLKQFSAYFKQTAVNLVKKIEATRMNFDKPSELLNKNDAALPNDDLSYKEFTHQIKLNKYYLSGRNGDCVLSKQEFHCLLLCAKGQTAKQIAKMMSLSPRTVEFYLVNVKNKLGCDMKHELIEFAWSLPLIKMFL